MRPIVSDHFDIFEIYHRYCDIKCLISCRKDQESQKGDNFREALNQLLKLVESKLNSRLLVLEQISKLMSRLGFLKDSSEFTRFYEFVFFISRENGQKNISTTKAISCWKLILAGRFRLLKQWCDFVEKNQRHNISEDTWRQVLAFSRCVHENLDGYDPKGAWPVLIDDFVDHMYRTVGYRHDRISTCSCDDSITQILEEALPGLRMFPGVKRKMNDDVEMNEVDLTDEFAGCTLVLPWKRRQVITEKQFYVSNDCLENRKNDKLLDSSKSPCAVDSCLSKGFAGLLTGDSCLQLESNKDLLNM